MKQKASKKPENKPAGTAPVKKERHNSVKSFFLDPVLEKHGLWVTMGLVSLMILVIFHDFLFGNSIYLFKDIGSDTINTFYPHFIYLYDHIRAEGFPTWSFAQGMGQNIQAGSMNNPFYWIVLMGGRETIANRIIWMEVVKLLLTGFFTYRFLKLLGLKPVPVILGTLLICFGGLMVVGGGWYIFSTELCYFTLLLWAFERLYQKNSWLLFPVPIALIAAVQPFNLFLYGLLLIFYFLMRHFSSENPTWRHFFWSVLQMAGASLLGLLISSFFFWSSMEMLLDSPRVGGNSGLFSKLMANPAFSFADERQNMAAILKLFSNDILGNGSGYRGWYNYLEAPLFYIGLLPLLVMPQVFFLGSRRKAIVYGIFFFLFLLPVIFPYFRYAVWLFSGDYYRGFSFFLSLSLLLLTLFALNDILASKKINLIVLVATFAFMMLLLHYPFADPVQAIDKSIQSTARNFLVIYMILLGLLYFEGARSYISLALLFFTFIELGYGNYASLSKRSVLTKQEARQKTGYNDYALEATAFMRSTDKQFYRTQKDYQASPAIHTSFNDAKAQGYYGTMVYDSFNQKYYIMFLEEMGIIQKGKEQESRWAVGFANRQLLQNLASTKYHITKGPTSRLRMYGYDSIAQFGDVKLAINRLFLPLGFTYDTYIPKDSFALISNLRKDGVLQKAFVSEAPVDPRFAGFKRFSMKDTVAVYTFDEFYRDVAARKKDTLAITKFTNSDIRGTIELDSARLLFFTIPWDKGWHSRIDGKEVQPMVCSIGFIGLFIEPGKHDVELYYLPPYFKLTLTLTLAGVFIYLVLAGLSQFLANKKKKSQGELTRND